MMRCRAKQASEESSATDWTALAIGSRTTAHVYEVQDYGIVCDLADPDIVGLIGTHQVGTARALPGHGGQASSKWSKQAAGQDPAGALAATAVGIAAAQDTSDKLAVA